MVPDDDDLGAYLRFFARMEQTDPTLVRRVKDLLRLPAPDDGSSKAVLNGALGLTAIEAENAFVLPSSKAVGSIPKSSAVKKPVR